MLVDGEAITSLSKTIPEKAMAGGESGGFPGLAREPHVETFMFGDDGFIPNHPRWPLIIYEDAVDVLQSSDPAAVFEELFDRHG